MNDTYGRLGGRRRLVIVLAGAVSGVVVDFLFAVFSGRAIGPGDLILASVIGGLLGLSASLGEKRRKTSPASAANGTQMNTDER